MRIFNVKLQKPLLIHSLSHSCFSIHCTNLLSVSLFFFFCISVFTFLEIIKHNMSKMFFSSIFNIKMVPQKFFLKKSLRKSKLIM